MSLNHLFMYDNTLPIPHDELVELLQDGKIGFLQYVMNGSNATNFLMWCKNVNVEPSDDSAEFFCEFTEFDMMEHQFIDNEVDGIWL